MRDPLVMELEEAIGAAHELAHARECITSVGRTSDAIAAESSARCRVLFSLRRARRLACEEGAEHGTETRTTRTEEADTGRAPPASSAA